MGGAGDTGVGGGGGWPPAKQCPFPESTLPPTLGLTCGRISAATQTAAALGLGAILQTPPCGGRSAASLSVVSWGDGSMAKAQGSSWGLEAWNRNQDPDSLQGGLVIYNIPYLGLLVSEVRRPERAGFQPPPLPPVFTSL